MSAGYKYKQAIVIRTDLGMSRGKIAVQAAHAAVTAVVSILESNNAEWKRWFREWYSKGQAKIVLRVESKEKLLELYIKAQAKGLPVSIVEDAGLTELPPGTITAIAIGPAPLEKIDEITGTLKLL